jgi:hypothetical protein
VNTTKEAKTPQGAELVTPANVESARTDTARLDCLLMRLNAQHHMPTPGLTRAVLDQVMAADAARPTVEP